MDTHLPTRAPRRTTLIVVVVAALVVIAASIVVMTNVFAAPTTPTPKITVGPADPTRATSASFTFTDAAPTATFACAVDSGPFAACTSPKAYTGPFTDGVHTFHVRAQKSNSATSATASRSWRVDTIAPSLVSINRAGSNPTDGPTLRWTVTFDEPVVGLATADFALATAGLSGNAPSIVSATRVGPLPATTWSVTVSTTGTTAVNGSTGLGLVATGTIRDAAGNLLQSAPPIAGQVYSYDSEAPAVTLSQVNGAGASFPVVTSATVTSLSGACGTAARDTASVSVSITGTATQSAIASCTGAGTWSLDLAPALSSQGTYRVLATQLDTAGNKGAAAGRIDITAPFTVTGGATQPLFPGAPPRALDLSISNPNNFAIRVTTLMATITSETFTGTAGTCATSDNFSVVQGLLVPVVIPAHSTSSLSGLGVAESDRPEIQMLETHVNQDACKGATLHLNYSGTAVKA
jgi:hypothetical protein